MSFEIKVPVFPESVTEGTVIAWHKQVGDAIEIDDILAEVETDKVVFEVPASEAGVLSKILVNEGEDVTSEQAIAEMAQGTAETSETAPSEAKPATEPEASPNATAVQTSPAVRKILSENNIAPTDVSGSGKNQRITKEDASTAANQKTATTEPMTLELPNVGLIDTGADERTVQRVPMSRIRSRIAERLLFATQSTAMLTTFNEVDMQPVMAMRTRYKDTFEKRHNVRLGFMSFFIKAACEALQRFPDVNAAIDGKELVYHSFCDVGVAVSTERGLVVPILRNAERMSIAQIESQILDFAQRAQSGQLGLEEITGGTFSITNGGVFGSMLSTPIVNPPQSAILGMHNIQKRAVVVDDQIVIRPIMYLALSYDHRIIDGKNAVSCLRTIKELLEEPNRILLDV